MARHPGQEEWLEKNWGALFCFFSALSCMEMAIGCWYQEISSPEAVLIRLFYLEGSYTVYIALSSPAAVVRVVSDCFQSSSRSTHFSF